MNRREFTSLLLMSAVARGEDTEELYAVPNFHPGCMGWLAPYHVERNYCLYSYLHHQDLVLRDPGYHFALSEIPHLITMREFEPSRFEQLQELVKKGRVELVNAFVLEPTVNLSGGEALVMQGVEGLRWYEQVMGTKPRHCWMIDITGWHEQMAAIVNGLDSIVSRGPLATRLVLGLVIGQDGALYGTTTGAG
jgi:Glycosyl hydrolases family 38 N-terminal domain